MCVHCRGNTPDAINIAARFRMFWELSHRGEAV